MAAAPRPRLQFHLLERPNEPGVPTIDLLPFCNVNSTNARRKCILVARFTRSQEPRISVRERKRVSQVEFLIVFQCSIRHGGGFLHLIDLEIQAWRK